MIGRFLLLLFLGLPLVSAAQTADAPANLNYFRYMSFGGGVHNLGWNLSGRYGLTKNKNLDQFFEFDFWRLKHPKEVRIQNQQYINPRAYTFGKQNDLFALHFGYGIEKLIFEKAEKRGVEVRYRLSGGLTAALLKPVYLEIIYIVDPFSPNGSLPRTELYDPDKHFADNIQGGAPFTRGLDEIKIRPGIYAKGGLSFEWGSFTEEVRILETGLAVDFFPMDMPIMAFATNNQVYLSLYLGIQLGKRW